jgi:hypothetical protein
VRSGRGDLCSIVDGVLQHGFFGESCKVPEGTRVLIPSAIAPECNTASSGEFQGGPDLASQLACARRVRAKFPDETFTLDGVPVRRLERYLVETGRFTVTLNAGIPDVTPGPAFAAAVGTTLVFTNLAPGGHTIVNRLVEDPDPPVDVGRKVRVVVMPR